MKNIINCANEECGGKQINQLSKPFEGSKALLNKRRHMKTDNNIQRIEYPELRKTIKKKIDCRKHQQLLPKSN